MSTSDISRYRDVVSHFATGVVVVTALSDDGPLGFTCQSFGSQSLEPILVTFSARNDSVTWPKIRQLDHLAINVLEASQESLAKSFAVTSPNKFDGVAWRPGSFGAPLITGALAHLEGRLVEAISIGDHDVAVVAIERVEALNGAPLVFFRGGFGTFSR